MFDLALISDALDGAVSNAESELTRRRVDYAGYPPSGKIAVCEDTLREAKDAREEFAKLRNALTARTEHDADDLAALGAPIPRRWRGKTVWMVPVDER